MKKVYLSSAPSKEGEKIKLEIPKKDKNGPWYILRQR